MRVDLGDVAEVVSTHSADEYNQIAAESGNFNRLFHLSDNRANVVEWLKVPAGRSALEIGAQAGELSAVLGKKYTRYVALDISNEMKNAFEKREDTKGLEYVVSDVLSYAKNHPGVFDDIYLIGGLAEADVYTGAEDGYETLLDAVHQMLKPNGRLILAMENRFGMKYWAGCREEYSGCHYRGIENFPGENPERTYSKKELTNLLFTAGFKNLAWYYPYPDLYFTESVYSDDYLPKQGELMNNRNNYDTDRFLFFDELKVFDSVIEEGMFPFFANSFLTIAYKEYAPTDKTVYVKYSKQRDRRFAIRTDIVLKDGKLLVQKKPAYPEGQNHVDAIYRSYDAYDGLYRELGLFLNEYHEDADGEKYFSFVDGENLQSVLEDLIQKGREEKAKELFDEYIKRCFLTRETIDFEKTDNFVKWYGDVEFPKGTKAFANGDCDLICSNIILKDDTWNIIDYEWSVDFPVPVKYLLYRSLFLAHHQIKKCAFLDLNTLMQTYEISEEEQRLFAQMDENFQAYVRGNVLPNHEILKRIGQETFTIIDWTNQKLDYGRLVQENERLRIENARQNKHCSHGLRWLKRLGRR